MRRLFSRMAHVVAAPVLWLLHVSGACSTVLMLRGLESLRWRIGELGAWHRFQSARVAVPAYRQFLRDQRCDDARALADVPCMDKANYVAKYTLAARCLHGELPAGGLLIDESSGSSGTPTNWVRGRAERAANGRTIRRGLQHRLGERPFFFLNAFALGPWATGVNLTLSMSHWCRIKSVGPDVSKIVNTLREFGPGHHYVIAGYPPFLKQVVDRADIDWRAYHVSMVFGGEAMSESMRRYLEGHGIGAIYGSYGASDLELNLAAETPLTIALRRLLETRPDLAARVLEHPGAIPMIFQYNPAEFFIERTADGELAVTICRPHYTAPKVRYNIHDLGHVMRFPALRALLADAGMTPDDLEPAALDLPLLFHYGRSDASVAYYGCKIPPADVQEAIFRVPSLAQDVDAFQLQVHDDAAGDKRLVVALEVAEPEACDPVLDSEAFFDALADVNQDFRESRRMVPAGKAPEVAFHAAGCGPFEGADIRVKRAYIARATAADDARRRVVSVG
jgi:phenylacetate-CoA ligase